MGGGVSSLDISLANEINRQKGLPSSAEDLVDIDSCRSEIIKLRAMCSKLNIQSSSSEGVCCNIKFDADVSLADVASHQSLPNDASDVKEIEQARAEVRRLRAWCHAVKLPPSDLQDSTITVENTSSPSEDTQTDEPAHCPDGESAISSAVKSKIGGTDVAQSFKKFDKDSSGLIDRSEMRRLLRMQGIQYSQSDFDELFLLFDVNNDGKFSYGEFVKAFSNQSQDLTRKASSIALSIKGKIDETHAMESFKKFDKDSSGLVDRGEMRRLLRMKGIEYAEDEFESLFTYYDTNGDGKLAFDEFVKVLQGCDD